MPAVLLLFLGTMAATTWLNEKTVHPDKDQKGPPVLFGWDARKVLMGAGVAEAFLGIMPGTLGPLIVGAGLGAYGSYDATARWSKGFQEFTARIAAASGDDQKKLIADMQAWAKLYNAGAIKDEMSGDNALGTNTGITDSSVPGFC